MSAREEKKNQRKKNSIDTKKNGNRDRETKKETIGNGREKNQSFFL